MMPLCEKKVRIVGALISTGKAHSLHLIWHILSVLISVIPKRDALEEGKGSVLGEGAFSSPLSFPLKHKHRTNERY